MIIALLQARMSSTRLPGKVMKPILGKPMLLRQVERVKRAKGYDKLVIATSTDPSDDIIERTCRENDVECFRGQLGDVLDRFYQASLIYRPEHIVRLTGDCPVTDPEVIDRVIKFYLDGGYDYASNTIERTYPNGLDIEIFRFRCLEDAWREANLPYEREHVTPFIYNHPERYRLGIARNSVDLSGFRWSVDNPCDFDLIARFYESLYPSNPAFSTDDILALLDGDQNP